ncbi:heterokaryon incompatibility protein-domain-containing protein [Collybia nuda]|uniref:Heterokaryon incompatibility protein-domain-containing protein n=1 Tax=Collybia nuda TaxID=64659 RepID=A0A9P5YI33_9AGAR|nr:heterokaryon incompatibility protein-domain-containing protein [Collybia nuda]
MPRYRTRAETAKDVVSEVVVNIPLYLIDLQEPSFSLKSRNQIKDSVRDELYEEIASIDDRINACSRAREAFSYAILSHRWGPGEPDFGTIVEKGGVTPASNDTVLSELQGYQKLLKFCLEARTLGFKYAWADICCIDKSSSAEWQESVNSMYAWYANSSLCIVYLHGLESLDELGKHEWFRRGWTLQELLAPESLIFYKDDWTPLDPVNLGKGKGVNDKLNTKIRPIIAETTGIRPIFLDGFYPKSNKQPKLVMELMGWASRRKTERPEDIAYCLLGIFNIAMPILYGEGDMAFHRLQMEIMKRSPDWTLLFWGGLQSSYSNLFAIHPRSFDYRKWNEEAARLRESLLPGEGVGYHPGSLEDETTAPPHVLTQNGLCVQWDTYPVEKLNCRENKHTKDFIYRVKATGLTEIFFRSTTGFLEPPKVRGHFYLASIGPPSPGASSIPVWLVYNRYVKNSNKFKALLRAEPIVAEKLPGGQGINRSFYLDVTP